MDECSGLENRRSRKATVGSNPTPSAERPCTIRHLIAPSRKNALIRRTSAWSLPVGAIRCGRLLRRILRRQCAGFCAALDRPLEVVCRHLGIVLETDPRTVPQPSRNNVSRILGQQFRCPRRTEVVKPSRPRFESRLADESVKLGSQVAVPPAGRTLRTGQPVAADHIDLAWFGQFVGFFEERSQLAKQRNNPLPFARVSRGLRAGNDDTGFVPVDVSPFER